MLSMKRHYYRPKLKEEIICGYCLDAWATEYDHLVPVAFRYDNSPENLFPSCHRCNLLAGSKVFDSIEEKINLC